MTDKAKQFLSLWDEYLHRPRDWSPAAFASGTSSFGGWERWINGSVSLDAVRDVLCQWAGRDKLPTLDQVRTAVSRRGASAMPRGGKCGACDNTGYILVPFEFATGRVAKCEVHAMKRPGVNSIPCRCSIGESIAQRAKTRVASEWEFSQRLNARFRTVFEMRDHMARCEDAGQAMGADYQPISDEDVPVMQEDRI